MKPSEYHGCATGDCPHEMQGECFAAVLKLADELHAEREALTEALTPSGETKGEYHGEFTTATRQHGVPDVVVEWTTIKHILKAIRERAARTLEKTK